jgi:hypothetical protein
VLRISGGPNRAMASFRASTQKSACIVFDKASRAELLPLQDAALESMISMAVVVVVAILRAVWKDCAFRPNWAGRMTEQCVFLYRFSNLWKGHRIA